MITAITLISFPPPAKITTTLSWGNHEEKKNAAAHSFNFEYSGRKNPSLTRIAKLFFTLRSNWSFPTTDGPPLLWDLTVTSEIPKRLFYCNAVNTWVMPVIALKCIAWRACLSPRAVWKVRLKALATLISLLLVIKWLDKERQLIFVSHFPKKCFWNSFMGGWCIISFWFIYIFRVLCFFFIKCI